MTFGLMIVLYEMGRLGVMVADDGISVGGHFDLRIMFLPVVLAVVGCLGHWC